MEEEKKQEKQDKKISEKINEQIDKKIKSILEQGIQAGNVDFLYKMVDIKKDMAEIEKEEQEMMYGNYDNYGRYDDMSYGGGRRRDNRGRYMESGSYGRRGVKGTGRGRYRGEEMMDEMMYHYGNYNEGREQYGADNETMESLSNLMESAYEYFKDLKENANSPEEIKMMEHYFKKMGQT